MTYRKAPDSVRCMRRVRALMTDGIVRLDDYEAAQFLGLSRRSLRKLLRRGVLRHMPDTLLFDAEELQDYLLSNARTSQERLQAVLRVVRWEARDLEKYPLTFRTELLNRLEALWEHLAEGLEWSGLDAAASGIRRILADARRRLHLDTVGY
jgi:hypothetical protein